MKHALIEHNDFANWYALKSIEAKGLMRTADAAALLNVKMPYINQLGKEEKIRKYTYKNPQKKNETTYYSVSDIMKIVSNKESIYQSEKEGGDSEVIDLNKYPKEKRYEWLKEATCKEDMEKMFNQWKKDNPGEAKKFKEDKIPEICKIIRM